MTLPVQSFASLVQQMAASVQGTSAQLIDLTVGSVLRAILEASASVALWLQWLILQVLSSTRAATCIGADLDSWMADFSLVRLPATFANGMTTFGRITGGIVATVPVGATVMSEDFSIQFAVIPQPSNSAWNGSNGYSIGSDDLSIDVPVQAIVAGGAGNVQALAISVLASPIAGVDQVANANPLSGGSDAESDASLRARFALYINSRSLATSSAIQYAVLSVRSGLRCAVLENQTLEGSPRLGNFCVVVDDGTGAPSADLLSAVQSAVDEVRPISSTYCVVGPVALSVAVELTIETNNPPTHLVVSQNVQAAILDWIVTLPIGGTLAISKLDAIAHAASASVTSVRSVQINNSVSDLSAPATGVLVATTVVVS